MNDMSFGRDLRIDLVCTFLVKFPDETLRDEVEVILHLTLPADELPFLEMTQLHIGFYVLVEFIFGKCDEFMQELEEWMNVIHLVKISQIAS